MESETEDSLIENDNENENYNENDSQNDNQNDTDNEKTIISKSFKEGDLEKCWPTVDWTGP